MLFNSLHFLIFLPIVVLLYYAIPHRMRWVMLLIASCYFYMALIPAYILVLFAIILLDYAAARLIAPSKGAKRRWLLIFSLIANVGLLFVFKYFNFFSDNVNALLLAAGLQPAGSRLDLILPIGLSFHTFQSMSYTIEVYRGRFPAERHLGLYALYVLFFPQMVAGPIERPQNVLPQLYKKQTFSPAAISAGLRLILIGFLRKTAIADNLAPVVQKVFENPTSFSAPTLALAVLAFTLQIYCDFAGYSDIARGSAKLLGIDLMVNFKSPYFATSISDFWRRWHISLSTWFRDYLYIPLGGNRVPKWRNALNLMIVFMVSGLWHGAAWTFVVWGGLHGAFLIGENVLRAAAGRLHIPTSGVAARWVGRVVTFLLVSLAWIFFRAESVHDAIVICKGIFEPWSGDLADILAVLDASRLQFVTISLLVVAMSACDWIGAEQAVLARARSVFARLPRQARWALYYASLITLFITGRFVSENFIYFQF